MRLAVGGIVHWRKSVPAWLDHLARLDAGEHELVPIFVVDGRDGMDEHKRNVIYYHPRNQCPVCVQEARAMMGAT